MSTARLHGALPEHELVCQATLFDSALSMVKRVQVIASTELVDAALPAAPRRGP